jgi:hypothetical protein
MPEIIFRIYNIGIARSPQGTLTARKGVEKVICWLNIEWLKSEAELAIPTLPASSTYRQIGITFCQDLTI